MCTTNVSFRILCSKGKILHQEHNAHCFATITYGALPRSASQIQVLQRVSQVNYAEDQIFEYIIDLNTWGFPCTYERIKKDKLEYDDKSYDYHSFIVPIRTKEDVFYRDKIHLSSALILIRNLYENRIEQMIPFYFAMKDKLPEADTFDLIQLAHLYMGSYANTNHTIREDNTQTFKSKEELFNQIKQGRYTIYRSHCPDITSTWRGIPLWADELHTFRKQKDYENLYKTIKEWIQQAA